MRFRRFYDEEGETLRQKWNRADPRSKKGGKQTAKIHEQRRAADAAKYGGEGVPDVSKISTKQLKRAIQKTAAKKARKSAKGRK